MHPHKSTQLWHLAQNFMDSKLGPGLNISFLQHGIWETVSLGQLDDRIAPTNATIYYDLASITKTFTALQILMLVQTKQLDLSQSLGDFIPAYRPYPQTTLRRVLTFSAGIKPCSFIDKYKTYTAAEMNILLTADWGVLPDDIGVTWYTDLGHTILGKVISSIMQADLQQCWTQYASKFHLDQLYFKPLDHNIKPGRIAKSELNVSPGIAQDEKARALGGVAGHAGLFGTMFSLQNYAEAWLDNKFEFSKELYHQCIQPQTLTQDDRQSYYSLVWRISGQNQYPNMSGFPGPAIILNFERREAVVLTCNYTFPIRDDKRRKRYFKWLHTLDTLFSTSN